MARGGKVENTILANGQNEGIERSVLPVGTLQSLQNVRMRKTARLGKRYGHTALATGNLGAGTGRYRAAGGSLESGFVIVDDTAYNYSRANSNFVVPSAKVATTVFAGSTIQQPGAVSGWLPRTAYQPAPAIGRQLQTVTPCFQLLALGALWSVVQMTHPTGGTDGYIRVVATDPTDQTLIAVFDFSAATAGFGGLTYPKLVLAGNTLVLTYIYTPAGGATMMGRTLTTIAGGFSAETAITGVGILSYDIYPYNSTNFLFVITYGGNALTFGLLTTAFVQSGITTFAKANPITASSIVGSPTTPVYIGYGIAAITTTELRVYASPGGALTGTVTISNTSASRPLLCPVASGGARCVHSATVAGATSAPAFSYLDISSAAVATLNYIQPAAYPISMPFSTSNGNIYVWAVTGQTDRGATLLKLPTPFNGVFVLGNFIITTLPIELSVQDLLVTTNAIDLLGLPQPILITDADYVTLIPSAVGDQSGGIDTGHIFRAVQATHFTCAAVNRSVRPNYADSVSFVALGALTRIDDYGPNEVGFIHKPAIGTLTPAAGGAMTSSADYYYTAIYRVQNSAGRYEVSAPCTPVKVTMGAADTRVTVPYLPLCISGRLSKYSATIEIYRTLANGQTFYLDQVISPLNTSGAFLTVSDVRSDASIQTQKVLYTQVGQTLANAFPPASRFSCVGGQRMFLGGLIRPDVVQASKLIFGDQSPSFCDGDAFKIVLPAPCTGIAWMDVLVMFTAEGIYIASGDGPDDSGTGDFGTLTRLPYELGCIEPRSVIVIGDGLFFQTSRGLYMLPRGFGTPIPAGDAVQDTLQSFPIITGCGTLTKATEQNVYWSCAEATGTTSVRVVYDLAHKVWIVDTINVVDTGSVQGIGQWLNGELLLYRTTVSNVNGLLATNSSYDDAGQPVSVLLATGDLRPFGVLSEGVITKFQVLAELRSACQLQMSVVTEKGSGGPTRTFALAGGDYSVGQVTVTDVELSASETRQAMRLALQLAESSTNEGLAFIAYAIEHEQGDGLKRVGPLSRIT